ncbi:unnamed protein product [Peronospora destructor]|uniref:Protein kinase domain-containing protein n=1 Tax=Peronospora destructor TaxID=86335 RepID=A0AAV0T0V2_9STRA|nr:unnamed protein product [Peronospora destructor]
MLRSKTRATPSGFSSGSSHSKAKKQRSIHEFFSQPTARSNRLRKARRSLEASAKNSSSFNNITTIEEYDDKPIQKRINYDIMDEESSDEPLMQCISQNSDSGRRPKPKKIDFTACSSSQQSEPDLEPMHTPVRFVLPLTTQNCYTPMHQYSQDEMDFLTPRDQPVIPLEKKISRRKRRSFPSTWVGAMNGSPVAKYLSDFSELGLIGSGSFSKVYKCVKKIDGWVYALKKSKRHFRGRADTERALREVQALAALSSSNHIVRYFDAWIEDNLLYIQLEYLEGCSLASFVKKYAPQKVPEETLCKLLCHLAQALFDMHSKKMVHMDVKLQNILVGPDEVYKLGDLGTVAHLDGSIEIREGDNRYLSRELLEGNRNNLRAGDIFALGATIYELALGMTLASGGEEWQKIRDGDLVMFRQYSNSLQHLIANMMHPDALQRPLAEDILQHEVVLPFR